VAICGNVLYSQTAVNLFKTYILRNTWFVKGALIAGTLIIYTVMIFGIYSFHVFMLEGVDFRQAYKKSAAIVKKHFVGTLGSLVMYNLGVLVIIGIFYVLISAVLIAGVKLLAMAYMGSAVYLSVLRAIRSGTKLFLVFIAIPVSYTVISRMYYKYNTQPVDFSVIYIRNRYYRLNRTIYFGVLILSVVLNAVYVVGSFNKNPFDKIAIFHETTITAHRGASTEAPENTLAAYMSVQKQICAFRCASADSNLPLPFLTFSTISVTFVSKMAKAPLPIWQLRSTQRPMGGIFLNVL
jgi:glycerophosphoryl diester phosphodiesterase